MPFAALGTVSKMGMSDVGMCTNMYQGRIGAAMGKNIKLLGLSDGKKGGKSRVCPSQNNVWLRP